MRRELNKMITAACVCATLALTGCAGDYLDTAPTGQTAQKELFENESYVEYAVNGLAKLMKTSYPTNKLDGVYFNGEGSVKLMYAEYQGADMYCPRNNFYTIFNGASHAIPTSGYTEYMWHYYYKVISNANTIITSVSPNGGPRMRNAYAQALVYRAYSYLQLLQFYAPRWCDSDGGRADGVVLRLDTSDGDCPLSSMEKCYGQIYADLDRALELFVGSGIVRGADENHKVNADVAHAVYARAALTREDWQTAAGHAAKARKDYPLMSNEDYLNGFSTVNSEWIWSISDSKEETLGQSSMAARLAYNSSSALVTTYPACINRELFDALSPTDIRRRLFLDPEDYSYKVTDVKLNGLAGTELTARAHELWPELNAKAQVYAYMSFKFKTIDGIGAMPFNLFRCAEMYLIEAEALCHLSPAREAEARRLLNELVRESGRDAAYDCTASGAALLDEIRFQRRIELWGEGFSWFDYKRRRDTIVRKTFADGGNYMKNAAVTIAPEDANNWMWAIPAKEYEYNDAINRQ